MSPHKLIQGAAFDPETVRLLSQAYATAVRLVGKGQPPPVLETMAKRIIESAGGGERDPQKMAEYAIRGVAPFPNAG
jgi:hypothetical protein